MSGKKVGGQNPFAGTPTKRKRESGNSDDPPNKRRKKKDGLSATRKQVKGPKSKLAPSTARPPKNKLKYNKDTRPKSYPAQRKQEGVVATSTQKQPNDRKGEGEQADAGQQQKRVFHKKSADEVEKKGRGESDKDSLAYQSKVLWEECRNKTLPAEKKKEAMDKLTKLVEGRHEELFRKRDTSRVLQSILKLGTREQKAALQKQLFGHFLTLCIDSYGQFLALKMLKYGTVEERNKLITQFYGSVVRLANHKHGCKVLQYAFSEFSDKKQKEALTSEFYGPEFVHFKDVSVDLDKIFAESEQKKKTIMQFLKDFLVKLANKVVGSIDNSIVHKPLFDYFTHANYNQKEEMIGIMSDHLVRFLHTSEGARTALMCIKYAKPKDRKDLLRGLKDYADRICKEEFGHIVILEIFSSVDDTTLINKYILSGMSNDLLNLSTSKHGHLCLLATLSIPTAQYFPANVLSLLGPVAVPDPQDPEKTVMSSKKDPKLRQEQIKTFMLKSLSTFCAESAYELVTHVFGNKVFCEVYAALEKRDDLIASLLKWINFDEAKHAEEVEQSNLPTRTYHPMEERPEEIEVKVDLLKHSLGHRTIKKIMAIDENFVSLLWEKIEKDVTNYLNHTYASWVIVSLLENKNIGPTVLSVLKQCTFPAIPKDAESKKHLTAVNLVRSKVIGTEK